MAFQLALVASLTLIYVARCRPSWDGIVHGGGTRGGKTVPVKDLQKQITNLNKAPT